jgi:hypothetical protein
MGEARPTYRLELKDAGSPAEGWPVPVEVRLRRALKALLRSFGLRCLNVEEVPADPPGVQQNGRAKSSGAIEADPIFASSAAGLPEALGEP